MRWKFQRDDARKEAARKRKRAQQRARYADPEYRARRQAQSRESHAARMADPLLRAAEKARKLLWWNENKARLRESIKQRESIRRTDPLRREYQREYQREWMREYKRTRAQTDPAYRARVNEYKREWSRGRTRDDARPAVPMDAWDRIEQRANQGRIAK